jgi:enoyl-CoA hydratase/carnithine racemase
MAYQHILYHYEENERIGSLTLNRPGTRNALSVGLLQEFTSCLGRVAEKRDAKVIIIRGAGAAFCAGHDLKEILGNELHDIRHLFHTCRNLMMLIHAIPQPVIAQVHGIATAAGCQLVAACDLAVAEETAQFATPGVKIGLFCSTPMVALSRAVGRKKALEMLLTGRFINAREALTYGLVNYVAAEGHLEEETWKLATQIAQYSSVALGLGKQAFYQQIEMAEGQAYHYATEVISSNAIMSDAVEGMSAFFEKRTPVWKES